MRAGICGAYLLAVLGALACGCSGTGADDQSKDVVYCSASSANFAGPMGYDWFLFANQNACATSTCAPNPDRVCAKVESPMQTNAGVGTRFNGPLDWSNSSGVEFTADVKPVGASFWPVISSGNGKQGLSWQLAARAGSTTYRVGFKDGVAYSDDGVAFQLTEVQTFTLNTDYATGSTFEATITRVTSW